MAGRAGAGLTAQSDRDKTNEKDIYVLCQTRQTVIVLTSDAILLYIMQLSRLVISALVLCVACVCVCCVWGGGEVYERVHVAFLQ